MARFRGTVQGGRGEAHRLGHSSLHVKAQSYSGDIVIDFFDVDGVDYVRIASHYHSNIHAAYVLYRGPVRDLLTDDGQHAIVRKFAYDQLEREYGEAANG